MPAVREVRQERTTWMERVVSDEKMRFVGA